MSDSESFGGCTFDHTSPALGKLSETTKAVHVVLSFEEALKLHLSMGEGLRWLNSLDRRTKEAKQSGLDMLVHLENGRVFFTRGKVSKG